jgi:hypothetical protein
MPIGMLQRFTLPGEMELQPLASAPIVRAVRHQRGGRELATVADVPPRRPLIGGLPHQAGVLIIAIRSREE